MRHLTPKDRTILAFSYGILYFALYFIVFAPGSAFRDVLSLFSMVFMAYLIVYYFIYPLFTRASDHFIGLVSPISFIVASMTYLLSQNDRILVTVLAGYVILLFVLLMICVVSRNQRTKAMTVFVRVVRTLTRPDCLYLPILLVFSYVFTAGDIIVTLFIVLLTLGKPLDRMISLFAKRREIERIKKECAHTPNVLRDDRTKCAHIK